MAVKLDIDPTWINADAGDVTYDAGELRGHDGAAMVHSADPVAPMPGVLHGLTVTVDAARLATIQQGSAELAPVPNSATAGGYRAVVAGVLPSETLPAPDATYDRRDIVCLEVRDPDSTGGTDKGAYMVTVQGDPAASPTAPTPTTGQLLLAEVLVPVSGAPTVIDRRQFTASAGAVINCTSLSRPDPGLWMRTGQPVFETDTGQVRVWDGSSWQAVRTGRPPIFWGRRSSDQSIPSGSGTPVVWTDDTPSGTPPVGSFSNDTMAVHRSGLYRIFAQLTFSGGDGDGYVHVRLSINNSLSDFAEYPFRETRVSAQYERRMVLNAGDSIRFDAYQNSGVVAKLESAYILTRCEIEWISD